MSVEVVRSMGNPTRSIDQLNVQLDSYWEGLSMGMDEDVKAVLGKEFDVVRREILSQLQRGNIKDKDAVLTMLKKKMPIKSKEEQRSVHTDEIRRQEIRDAVREEVKRLNGGR